MEPPKPPVPESNNPYFLAQMRGNILKCLRCAGSFKEAYPLPHPDNNIVIGRKEKDWFLEHTAEWGKTLETRRTKSVTITSIQHVYMLVIHSLTRPNCMA